MVDLYGLSGSGIVLNTLGSLMQVDIQLFGALRGLESGDRLLLDIPGSTVADARNALMAHAGSHWPAAQSAILPACAFALQHHVAARCHALA